MRDRHEPLPPDLVEALGELRSLEPPEALFRDLGATLLEAEAEAARRARARRPHGLLARVAEALGGLGGGAPGISRFGVATSVATLVLVGHLTYQELSSAPEIVLEAEHHVPMGVDGETWLHLELATGHHDASPSARVRIATPPGLAVHLGDEAPLAPACGDRCEHHFEYDLGSGAPIKVRLPSVGRYEIEAEHRSETRRVKERFLVHVKQE